MLNKINKKINIIGITKYIRIENYLNNLKRNVEIHSKVDKNLSENILKLINDRVKRIKRLDFIGYFFYFGIYFSIISFFFSDFFILNKINQLISKILGLFSSSTFIIGIFIINKLKDLYYQDLNLLSSHLIVIYDKHLKNSQNLYKINDYNKFINFFKKRGF